MGAPVSADNLTVLESLARSQHLLKARELAAILSMSVAGVFKAAREGRLPCLRIGYSIRFDGAQVARVLSGK